MTVVLPTRNEVAAIAGGNQRMIRWLEDVTGLLREDGAALFMAGRLVALVNFNGTGTVAIRSAANVASITDNGTGDYTVNFATALVDEKYVATVLASGEATTAPIAVAQPFVVSQTASAFRFRFTNPEDSGLRADKSIVNVSVFR